MRTRALCVALGHPDLGSELTSFMENLCEGTQRPLMPQMFL